MLFFSLCLDIFTFVFEFLPTPLNIGFFALFALALTFSVLRLIGFILDLIPFA